MVVLAMLMVFLKLKRRFVSVKFSVLCPWLIKYSENLKTLEFAMVSTDTNANAVSAQQTNDRLPKRPSGHLA